MNREFDLAWGNPYFLIEELVKLYPKTLFNHNIKDMIYGPNIGTEEMISHTRRVIKETMGLEYKHIIMTSGATQGLNVTMRVLSSTHNNSVVVLDKYTYPLYNGMINKLGKNWNKVIFNEKQEFTGVKRIKLIDSPSNPFGKQYKNECDRLNTTIWDSVYHNKIYTDDLKTYPNHHVMVGSYSKLLGIAGVRIGYIATNYDDLANMFENEMLNETASISTPSQELLVDVLDNIDLGEFIKNGRKSIDYNREEISKLEYLFNNQPVQKTGMFYCAQADKSTLKLLDKCNIRYIILEDGYIRLSLGQTNELTKNAVKTVIKEG